jgi:small-conductance mechanosensitive channel
MRDYGVTFPLSVVNDITREYISVIAIIVGAFGIVKLLRWIIDQALTGDLVDGLRRIDRTRYKFFKNAVSLVVWLIALAAIISLVPKLKSLALTLFAGAGIFVAVIGFAAQQAFSNIISGIFIVIYKPFRVGDVIRVGANHYGIVEDITLRHTIIQNFENRRIIIPNATMNSETVINDHINDKKICKYIEVGISYGSDVHKAMAIMREICEAHPMCFDNRSEEEMAAKEPKVIVRTVALQDSSVLLRAYVWVENPLDVFAMRSDLFIDIKARFESESIEIPFPHRTVFIREGMKG